MSRVEHVALWVRDLDGICAFYADYFGAKVGPRYENPAKGFASRFLAFESGARIEVMATTSLSKASVDRRIDAGTSLAH